VLEVATNCVFIGVRIIKEMPDSVASGTNGTNNEFFKRCIWSLELSVVQLILWVTKWSALYINIQILQHRKETVEYKDRLRAE
jgi:hypothetical protein